MYTYIIMAYNLIDEAISYIYYVHVHIYLVIATSQAFDCSDTLLLGNVQ